MKMLLMAGGASVFAIASAHALPTSYSVGGLTFSNITCSTTLAGTTQGDCSGLTIANAPAGNGIAIDGLLSSVSGATSNLDVLIRYQLTSSNPISSVGLDFNGATFGSGIARAEVTEDAYASPGGTCWAKPPWVPRRPCPAPWRSAARSIRFT